ncbi:MAG: threonine/serine exporter family protein [Chloroflexi bacterium]|nr:threonine/serine exporter family protein [Chloroflexota bacterium]
MNVALLLLVLEDALWSALAATGFAMLFNVPVRTLPGCAILGAVGHAARTLLMQMGMSIEAGTLAGATLVGFLGLVFARRWKTPSSVYTLSGAIPMVPGALAYRTMIGLLKLAEAAPDAAALMLADVSVSAIKTGLILGAIAVGIAAPSLLFFRQRPLA